MYTQCKEEVERLIKEKLERFTKEEFKKGNLQLKSNSSIKLPSSFEYFRDNRSLYLKIKEATGKMQDDCGAFDSWAIAIKNWVPEIDEIILKWEEPQNILELNYQKFLYRVEKLTEIFDWLKLDVTAKALLQHLVIKKDVVYLVNEPTREEKKDAEKSEATYERLFMRDYKDILANVVGMTNNIFHNQLPCGVFNDKVELKNRIMIGFIDIWGLNKEDKVFNLFELKKPDENPISIISEAFFYAMVRKSILDEKFTYEDKPRVKNFRGIIDLINSKHDHINVHLLESKLHPLIDPAMLTLMNDALKKYNISFDFIRYSVDPSDPLHITECKREY